MDHLVNTNLILTHDDKDIILIKILQYTCKYVIIEYKYENTQYKFTVLNIHENYQIQSKFIAYKRSY